MRGRDRWLAVGALSPATIEYHKIFIYNNVSMDEGMGDGPWWDFCGEKCHSNQLNSRLEPAVLRVVGWIV